VGGAVALLGRITDMYRILFGKHEEKILLREFMRKCTNNTKNDFKEQHVKLWTGFMWLRIGSMKTGTSRLDGKLSEFTSASAMPCGVLA
jgi:hypothetical protein